MENVFGGFEDINRYKRLPSFLRVNIDKEVVPLNVVGSVGSRLSR